MNHHEWHLKKLEIDKLDIINTSFLRSRILEILSRLSKRSEILTFK